MAINPFIPTEEAQAFIRSEQAARMAARGLFSSPFVSISAAELSVQINAYRKAREKLPTLAAKEGIVYPGGIPMEQCSSEQAARYKATLVPPGERCADITGGFGIDTLALSERFRHTEYYETNPELAEIARHNFIVLDRERIAVHALDGAKTVMENETHYDLVYLDPARRDAHARRVFSVSDCTPDLTKIKDGLLRCCTRLMVKLSPMLDLTATRRLFPETSQIHVVAVRGEVKELLFLMERGFSGTTAVSAVDLRSDRAARVFSAEAENFPPLSFSRPARYLYDPSAALRKAGLADAYCASMGLDKIHPQTSLYTADEPKEDFQGRVFRTIAPVNKRNIGNIFPFRRASVVVRNHPCAAADLVQRFKLGASDRYFLLAFRNNDSQNVLWAAERIDP